MHRLVFGLLAAGILIVLTGCGTSPTSTFYSLKPISPPEQVTPAPKKEISLRINRFVFPDYLDRPSIVTRSDGDRIQIAEFHRWAGSLSSEFHRVLGADLGVLLNTPRISVYPGDATFHADFHISGNVVAFDGTLNRDVRLDVYWSVSDQTRRQVLAVRHSVVTVPVADQGYDALVAAYGRALEQLSTQMQTVLLDLPRKTP